MSYYYSPEDRLSDNNIPLQNRPFHRTTQNSYSHEIDYDESTDPFNGIASDVPPPPPPHDSPNRMNHNPEPSDSFNFENYYDGLEGDDVSRSRDGIGRKGAPIITSPDAPPPPPKDPRYSRYSRLSRQSSIINQDEDAYTSMGVLENSMSHANNSNDLIFDYDEASPARKLDRSLSRLNRSYTNNNVTNDPFFYDGNYDPNKPPPPPPRDDDYYDARNRFARSSRAMGPPVLYEDDEEDDRYISQRGQMRERSDSAAGLMNRTAVRQRIHKIKWLKLPWFCWTVSIIQIGVFIAELVKMGSLTGSPIQTQPSFNPMVGPSSYIMINMGARFTPCMHFINNLTDVTGLAYPCPNSTSTDTNVCSLSELCGMGGLPPPPQAPDQWWRFITPIFLHAGFVHIGFNLLLQLKLGTELEREIGIVRFFIVYFASGIAGFVLGGNFTPDGIASTGASGSLFGVIAIDLLDLLFNWQLYASPKRNLAIHIGEIIVSFVLGLLPGLDNFSHIGGFCMGILTGTAILRSPLKIRLSSGFAINPQEGAKLRASSFDWRHPKDHFRGRSRSWYLWVLVRMACIVLAIVYFVTLIRQFRDGGGHCSWCKYLSCLPVHGWCDDGNITTS
ncbi:hypothetical protein AWJ20_3013 [Sugiyamaella lignohabitans]|uniref:Rhomboid-type serine protease n=1 Tax=Sugiyamaella lignohabitans TaxID=796027 RepID=A0A167FJN3_9ASCO|nr:uncharacterized protein AWJ20_3013 [Sugiyamaella lignohabitans]ANB15386.1 hypothetical protein AWJ20_3013 [Sugiyamaella lignohabitans]